MASLPRLNPFLLLPLLTLALLLSPPTRADDGCALALRGIETGADLRWRGPCKEGYAHGEGVIEKHGDEGRPWRYAGMVEQGRPHGKGTLASYPGKEYTGGFRDGLEEGQGVSVNLQGDRYEGEWKAGKREGQGSIVYALGGRYDGEWKNDQITGRGVAVLVDGRRVGGTVIPRVTPDVPAPTSSRTLYLRADEPRTGSHILHRIVAGRGQPYGASWEQLSEEQRHAFRSRYALLDDNDEPPYPLGGIGGALRAIHHVTNAEGEAVPGLLSMIVMVDSEGNAQSARTVMTPTLELSRLVAEVAMKRKYKPARCSGKPCTMAFPYLMEFAHVR
ncbi:hypothetical protein IV454_07105 [Massilia antarctica]|uniref:MORN repeat protein n=1 Tax=Massilia antarctica TaxID=2765360 RepID=A0AA48WER2_9BURK|nr:hypothetical protein [Massilia antarctica]QPI51285.1 hypothetical protein IV454_07105 [Massilia antarctica]